MDTYDDTTTPQVPNVMQKRQQKVAPPPNRNSHVRHDSKLSTHQLSSPESDSENAENASKPLRLRDQDTFSSRVRVAQSVEQEQASTSLRGEPSMTLHRLRSLDTNTETAVTKDTKLLEALGEYRSFLVRQEGKMRAQIGLDRLDHERNQPEQIQTTTSQG
ncbi:MAG: hypothetical protein M1828_000632 [Chrysothrix sp. TS-e1954]|nr:MAG: hypothetical protein M1828_000632 [Chrysothrix sp. TS-e1954]